METVIIVIHLMVVVALIAVVLLQRSEGGALGIGGGNAFMSVRGQGNVLTKATGILAFVFFTTSIGLTILHRVQPPPSSILDQVPAASAPASVDGTVPAGSGGGILDELNAFTGQEAPGSNTGPATPQVPTSQ